MRFYGVPPPHHGVIDKTMYFQLVLSYSPTAPRFTSQHHAVEAMVVREKMGKVVVKYKYAVNVIVHRVILI